MPRLLTLSGWLFLSAFAAAQIAVPTGPAPERLNRITNTTGHNSDYEYVDANILHPQSGPHESDPIDDANEALKREGFSCLGTTHVSWSGAKGSAADRLSIHSRYVIECTGNCRGVRYLPRVQAVIFHFGTTQPVPVLDMKAVSFGGSQFRWDFTRPSATLPAPDINIHEWTSGKLLNGPGCKPPKVIALSEYRSIAAEAPTEDQPSAPLTPPAYPRSPSNNVTQSPATRAYTGPPGGSLIFHAHPIPPNGEVVFEGLPNVPLKITYNARMWTYRLEPSSNGTQRLILHSIWPTTMTSATAFWAVTR
jgi:hypothetical protein